jgi:tetratricopeptide (TPR) repeat protein
MRRWMWLALAAVVVIAAGVSLVALPEGQEWTSKSPEAVAEFQTGMDAAMKIYYDDAQRHYRRAVELDPDFVIANLFAIDGARDDKELVESMWSKVEQADLSKLTPRERFFVERARARHEKRYDDAEKLIDEYVAKYPNDPYILHQKALLAWGQGNLDEAERLNLRLVEISPNWVIAYNQLGYINMMKGRFSEAEEYFKSYRFIAPDQANPYDSLGELFITMGRYDEARETLNRAIEIKPDFWAAYQHLVLMNAFNGNVEAAEEAIARLRAAGAPQEWVFPMECLTHYTALRNAEAWKEIMDEADSECVEKFSEGFSTVTTHFAACKLGDWEKATAIEYEAAQLLAKVDESPNEKAATSLRGALLHMQGVRLALQGDYSDAEEKLRQADDGLTYMEAGSAIYKLFNRMVLAEVLLADGKDADAHGLLSKVRAVNPVMVAEFEDSGLKALGLDRM